MAATGSSLSASELERSLLSAAPSHSHRLSTNTPVIRFHLIYDHYRGLGIFTKHPL